ncbi:hypothetical protein TRVA0_041S00540 [Trichomonascus vanleenenianus]|uniref:Frag1/DRAM/Sfk1 family protein n=1 Tax=Trichomonascus vanleenenianus TaxID=2268995 RepID=UPI003ECB4BCB
MAAKSHRVNAKWVAYAQVVFSIGAFASALATALLFDYRESVKTALFEFPQEFFPSVTAVTGEKYPEKSFFQVFTAITSGARFLSVVIWYLLTRSRRLGGVGLLRILAGGGFTFITPEDDHDWHDFAMFSYVMLSIAWMAGVLYYGPRTVKEAPPLHNLETEMSIPKAHTLRRRLLQAIILIQIPLGHFFIQHKLYQKPGAYSMYALCEWAVVAIDVAFDYTSVAEFKCLDFDILVRPWESLPFDA